MKKNLLSFNLLLFFMSCFGQDAKVVLDSTHLYATVQFSPLSDNFYMVERTLFSYDDFNRKIREDQYLGITTYPKDLYQYWIYQYPFDNSELTGTITNHYSDEPVDSIINEYNCKHQKLREIKKGRQSSGLWEIYYRESYEYNSKGQLSVIYTADRFRVSQEYNVDGLVSKITTEEASNGWSYRYHVTYDYDDNGNVVAEKNYTGNVLNIAKLYTYNGDNLLSDEKITYTGSYPGYIKKVHHYNSQNLHTETKYYYKRNENESYKRDNWNRILNYDNNGNLFQDIYQNRHDSSSYWFPKHKTERYYDNENRMIEAYNQMKWDTINQKWIYASTEMLLWEYNAFGLVDKFHSFDWNSTDNDYTNKNYRYEHFYSEREQEMILPENENGCMLANPFVSCLPIYCDAWSDDKLYQIQVFSIDGKAVFTKTFNGQNGLSIDKHFEKGWYVFVVLDNGQKVHSQKILVR